MIEFGPMMLSGCLILLGGQFLLAIIFIFTFRYAIKHYRQSTAKLSINSEHFFSKAIAKLQTWREDAFQDLVAYPSMV